MLIIPALDLRGAKVVNLHQGDFSRETAYADEPLGMARAYVEAGARRLHVVDLDAARGSGDNRDWLERLLAEVSVEVQVAGGVRDPETAARWLRAGAALVVLGTTAVREPEVLAGIAARHPGRVLAALDVRGGRPAVTGWLAEEAVELDHLLGRWERAELAGIVLTSIDQDGTMAGPDLAMLAHVRATSRHPVIYSGGIGSLDDVRDLRSGGAQGAILGRALLDGRFSLGEALETARPD
jgi:phosphoribosylformimino-5-aminoimidazole carboxamide ribotide isomerase